MFIADANGNHEKAAHCEYVIDPLKIYRNYPLFISTAGVNLNSLTW